jgi:hypothetical protein
MSPLDLMFAICTIIGTKYQKHLILISIRKIRNNNKEVETKTPPEQVHNSIRKLLKQAISIFLTKLLNFKSTTLWQKCKYLSLSLSLSFCFIIFCRKWRRYSSIHKNYATDVSCLYGTSRVNKSLCTGMDVNECLVFAYCHALCLGFRGFLAMISLCTIEYGNGCLVSLPVS